MPTSWSAWYWHLVLASLVGMGGAIASFGDCAHAQIKPDGTLGAESSVVTPTNINGLPTERIDGGAVRGTNLFHSFEQFSIPTGSAAYFNNGLEIQNIISRVTGESISNIDGLIRANGTANLFLINPNGIIFGPSSSLDVRGSFVATTANAIQFGNQGFFSASAPDVPPLLTVNPSAFFFNQIAARPITINSRRVIGFDYSDTPLYEGLKVPQGRSLLLLGGDVSLARGNLQAPGGRVELGGLAGTGTVGLNVDGNNLSLSFPDRVARADVSLTNGSAVDVTAGGGGSIALNARNLDVLGGSSLSAGIQSGLGSVGSQAGDITLDATDAITVEQLSRIDNKVNTDAIGQGGNLTIKTRQLLVRDGGRISASTEGQGQGGKLDVIASDSVEVAGRLRSGTSSLAAETTGTGAAGSLSIQTRQLLVRDGATVSVSTDSTEKNAGAGGSLTIKTEQLVVRDGGQISAATAGVGAGGTLTVNASESVEVVGTFTDGKRRSSLETSSGWDERNGTGKAGSLTIHTGRLSITGGAVVSTSTFSQGEGGDLNVIASDYVEVAGRLPSGHGPSSLNAYTEGTGAAGNLSIQTRQLLVRDGAELSVSTDSKEENAGAGGSLTIETGQLVVRGGGSISGATAGFGSGGTLTVNASESVEVDGTGTFTDKIRRSSLETSSGWDKRNGTGKAGSLTIHTGRLSITGGAVVSTSTFSQGEGGDLNVIASDSVEVVGRSPSGNLSSLAAETTGTGAAGNLNIQTRQLLVRNGGNVSAETSGVGKGGDLNIETGLLDVQDSGTVTVRSTSTESAAKRAGRLEVTAQTIRLDNHAAITAETASGQGGDIILEAQDLLLLQRNSNISTNAGIARADGNGGNITIDTPFIVAVPEEDSNITANAFTGNGGRVKIKTQGVFGLERREELTPLSDIAAFSEQNPELNGVVQINTPDVDPSLGLVALATELVDASGLIAQTCPAGGGQGESEFIVTGRGGLPDNPSETLSSDAVEVDLVTLNPKVENRSSPAVSTGPTSPTPAPIVEAQGWVIGDNGKVILTALAPTLTPHSPGLTPTKCGAPKDDF